MLCPKCGEEYEGSRCLRCEGPEIIINNEDYLRRRKAYEEKQAGNKSAFSGSKPLEESLEENISSEESIVDNEEATLTPEELIGKVKKVGEAIGKKAEGLKGRQEEKTKPLNKKQIVIAISCIIILAVVLVALFIPKLNKTTFYATDGSKLYGMEKKKLTLLCEFENAIFTADEEEYYTPSVPETISNLHNIDSKAAKGGRYFSTVAYDESAKLYSIYIWNEEKCVEITNSKSEIKLLNVLENGFVIYTLTEVIDDEGKTGATGAYIFKTREKRGDIFTDSLVVNLAENVATTFVYDYYDSILCYTKNDELYIYTNVKDSFSKIVKDEIDCVYAWEDDVYTYYADSVNFSKAAKGFIYCMAGECYYYDLSDAKAKDVYVGNVTGAENRFVYVPDKCVYVFNHTNIKYGRLSKGKTLNLQIVAMPNQNTDVCYVSDENVIYYVDEGQSLNAVINGEIKKVDDDVTVSSLKRVLGDKGITYIKSGECLYKSSLEKSAISFAKEGDLSVNRAVVYYDGYIYFTTAEGMLDRCKRDGTDYTSLGKYDLIR